MPHDHVGLFIFSHEDDVTGTINSLQIALVWRNGGMEQKISAYTINENTAPHIGTI